MMNINLKGRDFLSLVDYDKNALIYLLEVAQQLKAEKKAGKDHRSLRGKTLAMIFAKPSPSLGSGAA